MTRDVVRVNLDSTLREMRKLFSDTGIHHLLVVDDAKLLGVISDRDILAALSPFVDSISERDRDRHTLKKRAHQIMSRNPISVSPQTLVEEATNLLLGKGISCLPVVSSQGDLEGIVTWRDLLRWFTDGDQ